MDNTPELTTWHQRQKLREFLKSRMRWQEDPWIQKWLAELDRIDRELMAAVTAHN